MLHPKLLVDPIFSARYIVSIRAQPHSTSLLDWFPSAPISSFLTLCYTTATAYFGLLHDGISIYRGFYTFCDNLLHPARTDKAAIYSAKGSGEARLAKYHHHHHRSFDSAHGPVRVMDHYGDVHHELHPSDSIPNAAYPDAPYQPGTGGRPPPDAMMGIHNHQALYGMNYSTPSHASTIMGTSSLGASSPSLLTQPSSLGHVSSYQHSSWPDSTIPDVPPPPYEPSRAPSSNSPLNTRSVTSHQHTPSGSALALAMPMGTTERGRGSEVARTVEMIPLQDMPTRPSATHPPPVRSSASSAVETGSNKPAPLMTARERRKRGLKICLIILIAFIIFAIALSVGIAMGVFKEYHHRRPKNDDYPPPPPPPLGY
ncbi:hypothetical protein PT974_01234 [Cladobotryum mycophilum]|uniref:Uncharacterized protein n=1 Tax=Cladobotryum mycophilum TaxID=491253 RepID=A0ABR0T478_9HYPO